jgi:hypothetical protein
MNRQAHGGLFSPSPIGISRSPSAATRSENVVIAAGIIAGAIGLTWFATNVASHAHNDDIQEPPNANLIASAEITRIVIPEAFLQMARDPSASASFCSHDAVQIFLQKRRLEKAWYAMRSHARLFNGKELMTTSYCRPFDVPSKTPEFRAVLETLAGHPPRHPLGDFSTARVSIIPERLVNAEPSAVAGDLLESLDRQEGNR